MAITKAEKYAEKRKNGRVNFIAFVKAEKELAASNPGKYRLKVVLLIWLAYGYIVGVLLFLLLPRVQSAHFRALKT